MKSVIRVSLEISRQINIKKKSLRNSSTKRAKIKKEPKKGGNSYFQENGKIKSPKMK